MSVPIKRILLKFSGEALAGSAGFGYDPEVLLGVCRQVAQLAQQGTQVAIVVGGGNLFRGAASVGQGIHRATADQMRSEERRVGKQCRNGLSPDH